MTELERKQDELIEAIQFIVANPDGVNYVCDNIKHFLTEGEADDNSISLGNEWDKKHDIVLKYLESEIAALKQGEPVSAEIKESIRQKINWKHANYDVCTCINHYHLVSRDYCKKCKKPLRMVIEDEILANASQQGEKAVSDEEINPYL
ncbi:MAG: hypothetical protein ABIJ40_19770 [Bacteroidota bacterium]